MAITLGMNCVMYRGTAGSTAATEMTNVTDVTVSMGKDVADVTTRGNNGYKAEAPTLKAGTVEFSMLWDTTDDDFLAIINAYLNDTAIALFPSDGAGSGLDGDYAITDFSQSQALSEAVTVSVTASLTASTREPVFVIAS